LQKLNANTGKKRNVSNCGTLGFNYCCHNDSNNRLVIILFTLEKYGG